MNMTMMTTPDEFLRFAKEMGLGRIHSTSSSSPSPSRSISNQDGYTTTGLAVLNNLCRLIEQIHQLKVENHHLRAHLELVDHIDRFQQRFINRNHFENDQQQIFTKISSNEREKFDTLSPTNSLKIKRIQKSNRNDYHHDDISPSFTSFDHDSSELIDNNSKDSNSVPKWNKVRHAFRFSLRRKADSPTSSPLANIRRQIPTISISLESDDDQLQDENCLKKKKKKLFNTNDSRQITGVEDTDQDDESTHFVRTYHRTKLDENETTNSSSTDRHDASSSTNLPYQTFNADDEQLLTRKQSKIARYRRKIRSKLDTVKKQFSDQYFSTSNLRLFNQTHSSAFDSIGSGYNHALLTAQFAPALTKSYQQKMRDWEIMQKSHFLVNYRRQSITPKIDFVNNSKKNSISQVVNDQTTKPIDSSLAIENTSTNIETLNLELEKHLSMLTPILSPKQRSLIAHQWREIMSEEIKLRYYTKYLQNKMLLLKELESNLKHLKTRIFCTKPPLKQQSMINLSKDFHQQPSYLTKRCHSVESLISMPASWILAVQSAAYSDVLDGTSNKTTERAILFNKEFFDELEQFKIDRLKFEYDSVQDLQLLTHTEIKSKSIKNPSSSNAKHPIYHVHLRRLSLISSTELPQEFHPDPVIPLQTITSYIEQSASANVSHNDLSIVSTDTLPKSNKRSRFDLKKSFQRSRSAYMTQFHSWIQRHRRQHPNSPPKRRKSAIESKVPTPCSTPKILGSPRLARLHQKFFKSSTPQPSHLSSTPMIPLEPLDDSDTRSQYDFPVRIYFPPLTPPTFRHVRIADTDTIISNSNQRVQSASNSTTPTCERKYTSSSSGSSSFRITTAKERRESFATLSNVFHNRCA